MDPKFVTMGDPDFANADGSLAGNPNSCATCMDHYATPTPITYQGKFLFNQYPQVDATDLGPGLNMSGYSARGYSGKGMVQIGVKLDDFLRVGGRIDPDTSSTMPGIKPVYVTFPGKVPFILITPPSP